MPNRKWKPTRAEWQEFSRKMREIDAFCAAHDISRSLSGDSYYFEIGGKRYRVSNHSIAASNAGAFDEMTGDQIRPFYHDDNGKSFAACIFASKTRIIEIYNDLLAGYKLDGCGRRLN